VVKRIHYGAQPVVVDDQFARTFTDFVVAVVRAGSIDAITFRALRPDHTEQEVTLVIGPSTHLMVEEAPIVADEEPDNTAAIRTMTARTKSLTVLPTVSPASDDPLPDIDLGV
jgi:hypothetical protein